MKLFKTIYAFFLMALSLRIFRPKKAFKGKRVAIIGAADSLYQEKNGNYIDNYDIVIRINKAASVWNETNVEYTGQKFTYLFHSFYENEFSGGGPIDFEKLRELGVQKVIHPNTNRKGFNTHLNFYKRHLKFKKTFIFPSNLNREILEELKGFQPTVGFSALYSVLNSDCKKIFITGFTFFKTPYAKGYRESLRDKKNNDEHIRKQGIHNPDKEFEVFQRKLKNVTGIEIELDKTLQNLIE